MSKPTALLLAFLSLPMSSFAWGPQGHRVVAELARERLSASALRQVRALLGNDDLGGIATWADEIRNQRPETAGWHFVDIPWNAEGFSESRDCYRRNSRRPSSWQDHHNCVVDRIEIFRQILADRHASAADRAEALTFLVHFVADIHQPLHALAEGRGGNEIHIVEFGRRECGSRPCNLHYVWDIELIEHSRRSDAEYVARLDRLIAQNNLQHESDGGPAVWADDSFRLAKRVWLNDGGSVDEAYYRKNIGIVDTQLARAGLRLASMLNDALSH
jgi:S1/P1 Nuclease